MPAKMLIIFSFILITGAYVAWDMVREPPMHKIEMESAPNSTFTDIDGSQYTLHDFKGKTVILNFWATWCPPCIKEFPSLLELAEARQDELVFIAVSVDGSKSDINRFFKTMSPEAQKQLSLSNVRLAHDPKKLISQKAFQVIKYPESFIIGPDGTIRQKIAGERDWASVEISNMIDAIQ